MVTGDQIRTVLGWCIHQPSLVLRLANRGYHTRGYRHQYNPDGVDVMAEDWDNLLILDACRYDLFEERHDLPGKLSQKESRAAHTSEFILGNFHDRDLTDTVYVTASPILHRSHQYDFQANFHDVVNVWQEDGWDEEYSTVLPETMVEYALEASERYPNKRLVVHFMQPHYPFIGADLGLDKRVPDPESLTVDIWHEMMRGEGSVTREEIQKAYRANFDRVHPHVEELLERLSGKTVVSSDHGNMLGERSRPLPIVEWGHPPGLYTAELVTVPWLEYTNGPRRDVVATPPESEGDEVDDELVRDRLRNLGYAE